MIDRNSGALKIRPGMRQHQGVSSRGIKSSPSLTTAAFPAGEPEVKSALAPTPQIKKSQGTSRSTSRANLPSDTVFCSPHESLVIDLPRDS
jgi:hypothetical protein